MASSSDKKRAPTESKSDTKMTVTDSNSMDIKDGRIFEADNPLTLSKEEEAEMREFENASRKYNEISKQIRLEALKREKEELDKMQDKSTLLQYAQEGDKMTTSDRIEQIQNEADLIEEMSRLKKGTKN